jgi:superoxide dismutase, Cu-Zn family
MKNVHLGLLAACVLAVPASAEILGIGKDKAKATIIDAQGVPIGTATITDSKKKGLKVSISVKGLKRGERAVHLHEVGICEGPKFVSAGPHWNPAGKAHGFENPSGAHAGDLPNLLVNKKGRATLKFDIPDARLGKGKGLLDEDGAAIVIHASSDDGRTDPSGNSGDRIACGVIRED